MMDRNYLNTNSFRHNTDEEYISRNDIDVTDEHYMNKRQLINLENDKSLTISSDYENMEDLSMDFTHRSDYRDKVNDLQNNNKTTKVKGHEELLKFISDTSEIYERKEEPGRVKKECPWSTNQFDLYLPGTIATQREEMLTFQSQSSMDTFRISYQKLSDKCEMYEKQLEDVRYFEFLRDFYFDVFSVMNKKGFVKFNKKENMFNEKYKIAIINAIDCYTQMVVKFSNENLFADFVEELSFINNCNKKSDIEEQLKQIDFEFNIIKENLILKEFEIETLKQNELNLKFEIENLKQNEKDYHMEFDKYKDYENNKDSDRKSAEKANQENLQKFLEKEANYIKQIDELKTRETELIEQIAKLKDADINNNKVIGDVKRLSQTLIATETELKDLKQTIINKDIVIEQIKSLEKTKQAEIENLLQSNKSKDIEIDRLKQIEILKELEYERLSKFKQSDFDITIKKPISVLKKTSQTFNIPSHPKKIFNNTIVLETSFSIYKIIKSPKNTKVDNNNNLPMSGRQNSRRKEFRENSLSRTEIDSFNINAVIKDKSPNIKPCIKLPTLIAYQLTSFTIDCHIKKYNSESQTKMTKVIFSYS
jgi:hypothetical protein